MNKILKILKFIAERKYLILSMLLDLAALVTLIKEGGSFHFWMLLAMSALIEAAHEFVSIAKKSKEPSKKTITWY